MYIFINAVSSLNLGGETAESTKVLALLLEVGLMQVRILVAAKW